jgi:DNA-binding transcriptional LysR family regulator
MLFAIGTLDTDGAVNDLNVEVLFNDQLVVVVGRHSQWARRRTIHLADLINEPWILAPPNNWNHSATAEAFQSRRACESAA